MAVPPPVRVSVIVPIFNPGQGFDELIASLDRQTMDAGEFEVILCDDGSDQSTRDRLDQVAAARAHVRVLNLPHTGWPGTPRNHGIEAARGRYVFFSDQDDRLFDAALEQLCDYADRHGSDVVVGKVVGVGRRIPRAIFRRDVPHAELGKDPLLELLTPHKLFRTSFLRANDIRFPDGRVRLEDHLFVMEAYFRADVISILASRPCYAWVNNAGSASSSRIDPDTYFPHLEAVLDLVEAHTEPGSLRDTLLRHWYRGKILKRMDGKRMVRYPDDYRRRFLDAVEPIARDRFGTSVEDGLVFPLRLRSALLRAGRRGDLLRLAEFEADLECRAEVTAARWSRAGKLDLTLRVRIVRDGEDALVFEERRRSEATTPDTAKEGAGSAADPSADPGASAFAWLPPEGIGVDILPRNALDASRDLRSDRVDLVLQDGADGTERRIPGRIARDLQAARITIDPLRVFGRRQRSLGGSLTAQVRHAGWTFETALRAEPGLAATLGRSPLLAGRRCELAVSGQGAVELRRTWPAGRARDLVARVVRRGGSRVRRWLPSKVRRRSG